MSRFQKPTGKKTVEDVFYNNSTELPLKMFLIFKAEDGEDKKKSFFFKALEGRNC